MAIASAPTSLNGSHHTIPEEEDECDMLSGQLSATVESMLCGAADGVCCGSGEDNVDGGKKEGYSASMTFGANANNDSALFPPAGSTQSPQRPPSVRHSVSSPLARQSSTLSSKSSYRRNKGQRFTGYDDDQLFESIMEKWTLS